MIITEIWQNGEEGKWPTHRATERAKELGFSYAQCIGNDLQTGIVTYELKDADNVG